MSKQSRQQSEFIWNQFMGGKKINNNPGVTINGCVYIDLSVLAINWVFFKHPVLQYPDSSNWDEPWTQLWQSLFCSLENSDRKRTLIMVKLHDDKHFPAAQAARLHPLLPCFVRRQWQTNIWCCSKWGGEARCATQCGYFKAPNPQQAAAVSVSSALKMYAVRAVKTKHLQK